MKRIIPFLTLSMFLFACELTDPAIDDNPNDDTPQVVNVFDIAGELELPDGPHDLAVKGNYVFACRDDKVYIVDVNDVAEPLLVKTFDDLESNNTFETLLVKGNTLYAGCTSSSGLYVIDISNPLSPSITGKYTDEVYTGEQISVMSLYVDSDTVWAGGSNGTNGLLVKFDVSNPAAITVEDHWVSGLTQSAIGGVWANNSHVFISTANGYIYSFDKTDVSAGPLDDYTFGNEPGHEHWGRTIVGEGSNLYWADWGAGVITVNISDPADMKAAALITHSSFRADHPDAEGTDAYDLALDPNLGTLYVANGWSGLLRIKTSAPGTIDNYVDYQENLYRCIALYGKYAVLGDNAEGISNKKGIKIIKVVD